MIQALLHNKLKDSFSDPHFKPSEDSLTSSVIGLMQYFPDTIFWQLLRGSCGMESFLPEDIGEIRSINFWEKMKADGIHNSNYVEPDVWIEFENYDIVIEAKKSNSWGQDKEQWKKEIISFNKTYEGNNKRLIFIALGGNVSLRDCSLSVDEQQYIIYTSNWYNLLSEVNKYLQSLQTEIANKETKGQIRLLNDLIALFAKHGHLNIKWLDSMKCISINPNSRKVISELWEFDNKPLLQNFYKSGRPITITNLSNIWKKE